MRWYLHLDMDAFFASVEQVLDPTLIGKPVIVGGRGGRGVVTSASYEARRFGVHSAMPGFQAQQLCPHGIFLPNRRRLYSEFSDKVFAILEQYSPDVRAISIDEGLVDLTGTEKLLGPPLKTADRIIRRIKSELGLPASGGLSRSRVVAKIAATRAKPHGLIYVPAGEEEIFLTPLPVDSIPGVGPKSQRQLLERGVHTVGDLLQDRRLAERYLDLGTSSRGTRARDHSIGSETTLDEPLRDKERMEAVLCSLVEEVGERLRRDGLYARCLTVKIRYSDFKTVTRSRTLSEPTSFDREIFAAVRELLGSSLASDRAVRLLGVSLSDLKETGWQQSLFDIQRRANLSKLYDGIDRLRSKYGDGAIGTAANPARANHETRRARENLPIEKGKSNGRGPTRGPR